MTPLRRLPEQIVTREAPSASGIGPPSTILVMSCGAGLLALIFLLCGSLPALGRSQLVLLVLAITGLNLAPSLFELATKRFDAFDAKHLFLGYFFLVFTMPGVCVVLFGFDPSPSFAPPVISESLLIRSLAIVLLSLSLFLVGCSLSAGGSIARLLPRLEAASGARSGSCAFFGILLGMGAFFYLMRSAGGFQAFLANRANWRTDGVIGGVGYLIFPVDALLPISALYVFLQTLPPQGRRLTWTAWASLILVALSIVPAVILGFRGEIVPIVLQTLAVWHYRRRRFHVGTLLPMAVILIGVLSVFGASRDATDEDPVTGERIARALIFRLQGIDTVERVVWKLEQGEPFRGAWASIRESSTILFPRAIWKGKPEPSSLAFSDIFFYDYFLARGDAIDAIRSGMAPTYIGDALWIGGLFSVAVISMILGMAAQVARKWRALGGSIHIFFYAIFVARFPLFMEAFQGTCNLFFMCAILCFGYALLATKSMRRLPQHSAP